MKKLYEKNELRFAIVWIVVYCVLQSLANPLNRAIGVAYAASAGFGILQTVVLAAFIRKNKLQRRYGMCKSPIPARRFLYYVPLVILVTGNLWNGAAVNYSPVETVCRVLCMLCVGFLEEAIFRGFLLVTIFYRGGSLLPCIAVNAAINALSTFANHVGTGGVRYLMQIAGMILLTVAYTLILTRTLPKGEREGEPVR